MTLISEVLGLKEQPTTLASRDYRKDFYTQGIPVTTINDPGARTINYGIIDFLYKNDAVSFNTINKMVQTVMSTPNKLVGVKKSVLNYFNEFLDNIGFIGQDTTRDKLFEYIFKDLFMYGNSFIELVFDKTDTYIVDLKIINAGRIDYLRSYLGDVIVDETSKPIGYTLRLPHGQAAIGLGDPVPEIYKRIMMKLQDQMFVSPKRIVHFKINEYGDKWYGVGVLEPVIRAVQRKLSIEEAQTNSIYTRGTYPIIAKVGSLDHEPSEQELNSILHTLQNMRHDRYFAFPYYVDVSPLKVDQSDIGENIMLYLTQTQASAAGIPVPFVTGTGQATNRATLNNQQQMWELVLTYYAKQMVDQFKRLILRKIKETNGISEVPDIQWGEIKAEEKNDKIKRIHTSILDGIIAPEEARPYILQAEGFQPNEKAYNEFKKITPTKVESKTPLPPDKQELPNLSTKVKKGVLNPKQPSFSEDQTSKEITTKKQ